MSTVNFNSSNSAFIETQVNWLPTTTTTTIMTFSVVVLAARSHSVWGSPKFSYRQTKPFVSSSDELLQGTHNYQAVWSAVRPTQCAPPPASLPELQRGGHRARVGDVCHLTPSVYQVWSLWAFLFRIYDWSSVTALISLVALTFDLWGHYACWWIWSS